MSACTVPSSATAGEFWLPFREFLTRFRYVILCYVPSRVGGSWPNVPGCSPSIMTPFPTECSPQQSTSAADFDRASSPSPSFVSTWPSELLPWMETTIHGRWTDSCAGGCLNFRKSFTKNPQVRSSTHISLGGGYAFIRLSVSSVCVCFDPLKSFSGVDRHAHNVTGGADITMVNLWCPKQCPLQNTPSTE